MTEGRRGTIAASVRAGISKKYGHRRISGGRIVLIKGKMLEGPIVLVDFAYASGE
jgi:hypothetical protein